MDQLLSAVVTVQAEALARAGIVRHPIDAQAKFGSGATTNTASTAGALPIRGRKEKEG
jgi:hypothetical protein